VGNVGGAFGLAETLVLFAFELDELRLRMPAESILAIGIVSTCCRWVIGCGGRHGSAGRHQQYPSGTDREGCNIREESHVSEAW
jgi:hypothetical protein